MSKQPHLLFEFVSAILSTFYLGTFNLQPQPIRVKLLQIIWKGYKPHKRKRKSLTFTTLAVDTTGA